MKKILIVDDNPDILAGVKYFLTGRGFEVYTHSTGLGVSEIVTYHLPNLILLDIGLPGKSGTDICRELKQLHSIPILFFSAHADEGKAYKLCGADGFIPKPFDIVNLLTTVNSFLN